MSEETKKRPIRRAAADQPARSIKEDALGRGPFAIALADAMTGWTEPESLVVALMGAWGTGKSTIKNFVVEALEGLPEATRPLIVPFTPWDVAGTGTVADRLLREIAVALKQPDASAADKQLAEKWEAWAEGLKLTVTLVEAVPSTTANALLIAGLGAVGASALLKAPAFELAIQVVGIIAAAVGAVLKLSSTVAERTSAFFASRAKRRERTLDALKRDLREAMEKRDGQLVVIVDEIDRLPANEVQLLLRAIRANADFPKVVFLLVFERATVEKAITDQAHVDGRDYLKKIIQIPFSIPQTESRRVHKVLFQQLDETLDDLPTTVSFDQRRWGNLFFGGLSHYVKTLRDVYRFTTTLEFHTGMFRSTGTMEVNQIDLLGLEALRVFEPDVYDALPAHRQLLLEGPGRTHRGVKKEDVLAELDRLLARAPVANHAAIKQILVVVFHPIEWLLQNYGFGTGFEEGWERELRACSERYFDRYFLLGIPEGDVSQREIADVLAAVHDRDLLTSKLRDLRDRSLLDAMLARLEAYKEEIDLAVAVPFITALFDIGDGLAGSIGMSDFGAAVHASRIVYWYLRRLPSGEERERVLDAAMRATTGTQLPVDVVSHERRREESQTRDFLISEARLPEFQALAVEKIRALAAQGALAAHSDLPSFLYRWREWAGEQEPREWAAKIGADADGAVALVRAFTQNIRSYGMGDRVATVRPKTSLKDLETFADLAVLDREIRGLDASQLKGRDAVAVAAFTRAMARRKAGKSEDLLGRDDDD
jgi:predicted KAP-like P-loop ATPase